MTNNETFEELLFERVAEFPPARKYSDKFWEEAINFLLAMGVSFSWSNVPIKNDPKYIIDNIAVNGQIVKLKEAAENYSVINDEYGGDGNAWIEDNGYQVIADYVVINWGF